MENNFDLQNLTGKMFGRLKIVCAFLDKEIMVVASCSCNGKRKIYKYSDLIDEKDPVISCGCFSNYGGFGPKEEPMRFKCRRHCLSYRMVMARVNIRGFSKIGALIKPSKTYRWRKNIEFPEKFVGKKFNKLTVIKIFERENTYRGINAKICTVQCECGKVKDLPFFSVINGVKKSCGCGIKAHYWRNKKPVNIDS